MGASESATVSAMWDQNQNQNLNPNQHGGGGPRNGICNIVFDKYDTTVQKPQCMDPEGQNMYVDSKGCPVSECKPFSKAECSQALVHDDVHSVTWYPNTQNVKCPMSMKGGGKDGRDGRNSAKGCGSGT